MSPSMLTVKIEYPVPKPDINILPTRLLTPEPNQNGTISSAPPHKTVAFEEVPLEPGGPADTGLPRATSRQCLACSLKATPSPQVAHHHQVTRPPDPEPIGLIPITTDVPKRQAFESERMTDKPESAREALEDRDPNNLNSHVQIVWDDVIGEPEGARSPECSWRLSNLCFQHARNWCYTLMAVIVAPPCALFLGCCFACLAFEQIWCTAPCVRCVKIYFASLRTMVQVCMSTFVVPAAEAVGHLFRHIRVNFRRDAPEEKDMLII